MAGRAVVIDGDPEIADAVTINLELEGWKVERVKSMDDARAALRTKAPELIVLDIEVPGDTDGVMFCKELRADPRLFGTAIIVLTVRGQSSDKVNAFDAGADDYVTKPFDPAELLARVKSVTRRAQADVSQVTHLPGIFKFSAEVDGLIANPESQYGLLQIDLNNFRTYNEHYGAHRGDAVLAFVGECITEALEVHRGNPCLAAHGGGDDFYVITEPEEIRALASDIIERFDKGIKAFYDDADFKQGAISTVDRQGNVQMSPIMGIAVGALSTEFRRPKSRWEVSVVLSEMVIFTKRHEHSAFEIDRRTSDR